MQEVLIFVHKTEYLKSEVFYGKARVKEIQKYPKTRFEYSVSDA